MATFLLALAEGEDRIEAQRQRLCGHGEFEPYSAFSRIDREYRGLLTASDLIEFMKSIGHHGCVSESEMTLMVSYYDSEEVSQGARNQGN